MIEKKIHYIWVGKNPLTPLAVKCIESWKKYCPEYEIIEWNEDSLDFNSSLHCKQAYESQKWGFVVDYLKPYLLYHHGGIYMDTDMELFKSLDSFLHFPAFFGFENHEYLGTAIIGAEIGNPLMKEIMEYYVTASFIKPNGKPDHTTGPAHATRMIKDLFPEFKRDNTEQHLEYFSAYTIDYFYPMEYGTGIVNKTSNSHGMHHFVASWKKPPSLRKRIKKVIKEFFTKK